MDHRTWVEIRKIRKTPEERCKLRDFCQAREYFKPEGDGSGFYGSVLGELYPRDDGPSDHPPLGSILLLTEDKQQGLPGATPRGKKE